MADTDIFELQRLLKRYPLLYVEHRDNAMSCGRFYALIENNEMRDITYYIARAMEMYDTFHLVLILNRKTNMSVKCLRSVNPETFIRDLSEKLFGRWNAINYYILENERSF